MSHIDDLEPYWLATSIILAIPTFPFSCFVYFRLLHSKDYSKSRYLNLFFIKALNEMVLFVLNLCILHLPIQNYLYPFFNQFTHSIIIPICGFILETTILASFLYGVFLSLNRYLAMAQLSLFNKYDENYVIIAVALIYPLPILFASRSIFWRSYFYEIEGKAGPIFVYFTPDMDGWTEIYDYSYTIYTLLCCALEFAINGLTMMAIFRERKLISRSAGKRNAEMGLFITTLCSFSFNVMFTIAQVCIQFFSFTQAAFVTMMGQLTAIDLMVLSSVYLLLAFSHTLRKQTFAPRHGIINVLRSATIQ